MNIALRLAEALGSASPPDLLVGDLADDAVPEVEALSPAAVLIAITDRPAPGLILTRRTETLRRHAGQIAFPGGRIDLGDADATAAALREAHEEIALATEAVSVIGAADRYRTRTGFDITPVIGVIAPDLPLVAAEAEVAEVFEAPLGHVLDPANRAVRRAVWQGRERAFYEIDWRGYRIWGATAGMLVNLSRRLRW